MNKPIHVKPSYYAIWFHDLKELALKYGYNLVLHGSLSRDMDLIAIPWQETIGDVEEMVKEFCEILGGEMLLDTNRVTWHGRKWYTINIYRNRKVIEVDGKKEAGPDPQYYLDISVMPHYSKPDSL